MAAKTLATTIFVHLERGTRDPTDRESVRSNRDWEVLRAEGVRSERVLDGRGFLDAALICANVDPDEGWELAWRLHQLYRNAPIFVACDNPTVEDLARILTRPLLRRLRSNSLPHWIDGVLPGWLHDGLYRRAVELRRECHLGPREYQCMLLSTEGLETKEVAAKLGIAPSCVEGYFKTAAEKTGCATVAQMRERLRREAWELQAPSSQALSRRSLERRRLRA